MDAWVLGCGPSLAEVEIPRDALSIGTNNSYERVWSPIYATSDKDALKRDYPYKSRALLHIAAIDPERPEVDVERVADRPLEYITRPERPMLRKSGVFAYWIAKHIFKADRVMLVGFDMETSIGHFDGREAPNGDTQNYFAQRERLRKLHDQYGGETWIWLLDRFIPLQNLPAEHDEVKEDLQKRGIMRYAYQKVGPPE